MNFIVTVNKEKLSKTLGVESSHSKVLLCPTNSAKENKHYCNKQILTFTYR